MRVPLALIEHRDLGHAVIDFHQPQCQVEPLIFLAQATDFRRFEHQLGRLFAQLAVDLSPLIVNLIGNPAAGPQQAQNDQRDQAPQDVRQRRDRVRHG